MRLSEQPGHMPILTGYWEGSIRTSRKRLQAQIHLWFRFPQGKPTIIVGMEPEYKPRCAKHIRFLHFL